MQHEETVKFYLRNIQRGPFALHLGMLTRLRQRRRDQRWTAIGFTVVRPGVYDAPRTWIGNRKINREVS